MRYDIHQTKLSSDIVDVISDVIKLDHRGKNYTGLCPFHEEKTPSFSVSRDKQRYHCFGCGESGDVVDFVRKYHGMALGAALAWLAQRAGLEGVAGVTLEMAQKVKEVRRKQEARRRKQAARDVFFEWRSRYAGYLVVTTKTLRRWYNDKELQYLRATILFQLQIYEYHQDILDGDNICLQSALYSDMKGFVPGAKKERLFGRKQSMENGV